MKHVRIASGTQAQTGNFDALELRLDLMLEQLDEQKLEAIIEEWPAGNTVATYRPTRQGGAFDGDDGARINVLRAIQSTTGATIDLEADLQDGAKLGHLFGSDGPLIRSLHLNGAPEREAGLNMLTKMQDEHGDIQKLAFPCASFLDQLRALELCWQHSHHGNPAIVPQGNAQLRALLVLAGNKATYGAASTPVSPTQPSMDDINDIWDHWKLDPNQISPKTYWLAVIGHPIDHSLSPAMHNLHFQEKGRPERMGALDVPDSPGAFRLVASVAARIGLAGASVTHPHKQILVEVAEPDPIAKAVGAANCVDFTRERCTNTDATAMARILPDGPVTILGRGAFAQATLWACQQRGLEATVCARADDIAKKWGAKHVDWQERQTLRGHTLVQATPISGEIGIDVTQFKVVLEAVYAKTSRLRSAAEAAGVDVITPEQLLREQGLDAYRFWFTDEPGAMELP